MPKLCPLFSGSSGNSYYLESAGKGILIDCGRNAKQIEAALGRFGADPKNIRAVFITHEHSDHINALKVFAARYKVPVYASNGTVSALEAKNLLSEKINIIPLSRDGIELDDFFVLPFRISHDCSEGYGFCVESQDGRKTAFATDTGIVTDEIINALTGCDTVVLESNHDVGMLQCGGYPYILKRRILSDVGHLSNESCAETAVKLVSTGTTRLLLAHLSRENNIPELAKQASLCELETRGMKQDIDFMLSVVPESGMAKPVIY